MKFSLGKKKNKAANPPTPSNIHQGRPVQSPIKFGRNRFKARSFWESLHFASEGLKYIYQTQLNFRIDIVIGLSVIGLGILFQLNPSEWAGILLTIGMILFAEAINTAIEYTVDMVTQGEFDMRAKVIKDIAAGACLTCSLFAVAIGSVIFMPHLLQWLQRL
jgi:undecaprenol kinase